MLSRLHQWFRWHLATNLVFPLVCSPIPCDQGGHRSDWKDLISYLDIHLLLCTTQIFQTWAQNSFLTVITVSFNKLELLLRGKQHGRWAESHVSMCGDYQQSPIISSVAFSLLWLHFLAGCSSPENADFWLNPEYRNWQTSSMLSGAGGVGRKRTGQQLCTQASMWAGEGGEMVLN